MGSICLLIKVYNLSVEAMASGALVFVDIMATPRPNALINEKHVIYYGACE